MPKTSARTEPFMAGDVTLSAAAEDDPAYTP